MAHIYKIGTEPDKVFIAKLLLLLPKAYQFSWRGHGTCRIVRNCPEGIKLSRPVDYHVALHDLKIVLVICGFWEHYALLHNVQPDSESRQIVLQANVNEAGQGIEVTKEGWHERIVKDWRKTYRTVEVLYVEQFAK